ncbi:hypothetical protein LX77_01167 [Gelidibacter algens]|jgi:hypothetical protein|uniref:Uncharacterized protein n=1 Tax=Gelidibacter algens TaxID=49280 RepID=A0A1A7R5E0_9FLAO|nr:hypothetical protein [Gelidibacter algens]OBX26689.1 hypothetical protein A9996_03790 [Gelidibacter algens]RAJ25752.1 hypothetical protein LX77_01167 [Gelidibacter algens]
MKKKLESELMSIAHRILKLKGKENVTELHRETGLLYEKLSVLKFANENLEQGLPTIGVDSSFFDMLDVAFNNKISDNIERGDKIYVNLDEIEDDGIMEPVMEKIKDLVAQMPHEASAVDAFFEQSLPQIDESKNDFDNLTAGFKNMPVFDPVSASKSKEQLKRSLNDKLKHGLNIGLNDKIAFIKHLFDGEREDYERVLSQINTASSFDEASNLIQNIVKPDYNNWQGKEDFELRFMGIIEGKFD